MAEVFWSRLNADSLTDLASQDAVVLLPVASTEQHGPHLPTGVDDMLVTAVCRETARLMLPGSPVVVAPTVWCGLADHHVPFGGTFSLTLPTYHALLRDLCRSIFAAGFRRLVIVNGHAGNIVGLAAIAADLTRELSAQIATATYFMLARDEIAALLEDQAGLMHACEAETSMMMAVFPDLVDNARLPEAIGPLFVVGAAMIPDLKRVVPFNEVTRSGVAGDARKSSPAKGKAIIDACAAALAGKLKLGEPWATATFPSRMDKNRDRSS